MACFDYVSDLHIDYWDPRWMTLYMNNGQSSNFPLNWNTMNVKSEILVVAGDVCDKLEFTVEYLKTLRKYYKQILFVDGNHEHTYLKPKLYTRDYIASKFKGVRNIYYLPKEDVVIGKTVFVGVSGWWDYGCADNIKKCEDYLIENYQNDNVRYAKRIITRAKEEADKLNKKIKRYENMEEINDIVVVTHTIPLPKFARNLHSEYNSFLKILDLENRSSSSKIKRWVFGHVHDEYIDKKYGIIMMAHPRGRPSDHNRKVYDVRTSCLTI